MEIDYFQSQEVYSKVQNLRSRYTRDRTQIDLDMPRTFPEEPLFKEDKSEGRIVCTRILDTISRSKSSAGYL